MQEIYINLDDSGKLTYKDIYLVYAGVVFLSKKEKDRFINQYRSIINSIKSKYYGKEIKNINIKSKDKRRIINFLKREILIGLEVKNDLVYDEVKKSKASKGRFIDYGIKMLIKNLIVNLIQDGKIDNLKDIRIIINIDEQTTKSNGYYKLRGSLYEELKYGITNFNYLGRINPVLFGNLDIHLHYHNSKYSYLIQAADLVAGTFRRNLINNENSIVKFIVSLP